MHLTSLKTLVFVLLLGLLSRSARADNGWEGHILSFVWENDATAGSDRHYTQGGRISYLSKDDMLPAWLKSFSDFVPVFGYELKAQKFGLAISQEIYTPEDLTATELVVTDRPYAAWLYGTATLQRRGVTKQLELPVMENLKVDLGVIGPEALGEETQRSWHGITPAGWHNQLKFEPGLNLRYDRSYLFSSGTFKSPWRSDFIPFVDISAGNILTYFQGGLTARFGYNIPNEFAASAQPAPKKWGAYLFVRGEGRWVLRNIFLDGNTFRDSHSVDKRALVADGRAGLALVLKSLEITAAHTIVSQEFKGQQTLDNYGTLTVNVKF
jgi:lipid A 3-O-deacylase